MMPDPEVVVVAWAKANTPIAAALGGSFVATRLPDGFLVFLRVGTISIAQAVVEGAEVAEAAMQFDVFSKTTKKSPDYATASLGARTLLAELEAIDNASTAAGTIVSAGNFAGPVPVEEEVGSKVARFRLDSLLVVRP